MSGTKSHCRPAPAIDPAESALVLGWYGSRNQADHDRMSQHVDDLVNAFGFASGLSVPLVLGVEGIPDLPVGKVRNVLALPIFMCDGLAMHQHFPAMLRQLEVQQGTRTNVRSVTIIGRHESLAQLIAERAAERALQNARDTKLLLVAHGSERNTASIEATRAIRDRIRQTGRFAAVDDAYLEASPCAYEIASQVDGNCIVEGLFLTEGRHSTKDLTDCIRSAEPGRSLACLGAVGTDHRFTNVLSAAVRDGIAPQMAA